MDETKMKAVVTDLGGGTCPRCNVFIGGYRRMTMHIANCDGPPSSWKQFGPCPKCGAENVTVRYGRPGNVGPPDWLEVTCLCGYSWERPTLDRQS